MGWGELVPSSLLYPSMTEIGFHKVNANFPLKTNRLGPSTVCSWDAEPSACASSVKGPPCLRACEKLSDKSKDTRLLPGPSLNASQAMLCAMVRVKERKKKLMPSG